MLARALRSAAHYAYRLRRDARWAGDWATFRSLRRRGLPGVAEVSVRVAGRRVAVHVREGTLDLQLARQILCDESEYEIPVRVEPRVILDIGANIGLTALYFAAVYPEATIYCFEPLPENIELLRRNTAPLGERVRVVPVGLGDRDGSFEYHRSNDPRNLGGGTFHRIGCEAGRPTRLPVTTLRKACAALGIERADVIKLDTEGAEWSILRGAPPELIEACGVLLGELHGVADADVLGLLGRTHRLAYHKRLDRSAFPFLAVRRADAADAARRLAA